MRQSRFPASSLQTNEPGYDSAIIDSNTDEDEPECIRRLSAHQKDQLGTLLDEYLRAMEVGLPPSPEQLTAATPELTEPLRVCVQGLEDLQRLAIGDLSDTKTDPRSKSWTIDSVQPEVESVNGTFGEFQLHETVGRGGMGIVYRATQTSLHRTVAVKILPIGAMLDPRQLTRFKHEAEAAAQLQHPNIVPVHAIGCQRGIHYYAMRYIDGPSIEQWIDQSRDPADWRTPVRFAIQAAAGIHAAHEFGIIHRDIKPSNLLLDQNLHVWIADFGLARIQSDVSLTGSSDVVGTVRYMSPEQARGESAMVDGRTDVYSLAVTLYEMITGEPAHDRDRATDILRQIHESAVRPLHRVAPHVPRDLSTVIAKAMSSNRDGRYETAQAFAEDLQRVLDGEPTIARPPSIIDLGVRFADKHRRTVLAGLAVVTLALAGFSIANAKLSAEKRTTEVMALQSQMDKALARDAIDRLGTQISEQLANIPAAREVRHRLLTETLAYYENLANRQLDLATSNDRAGVDAELETTLQQDLAITYGKMGVLQSELGQTEAASDSLRRSESRLRALAESHPENATLQLQWSISQNNLAQTLCRVGEYEVASRLLNQALTTQNQLMEERHSDATVELAKTLNSLATMLSGLGELDRSRESYEKAILLLTADPTQTTLLSTIRGNLAGMLSQRDPQKAIELARESLRHQLDELEDKPSDPVLATRTVTTLNTLGEAQLANGDHADAAATLERAIRIGEELHDRWPDQPVYHRDLVISWNQLGRTYSAAGDLRHSYHAFDCALEYGSELKAIYADDAEVQSMVGGILNNIAFIKQKLGDPIAADRLYRDAIEQQQVAIRLAPEVPKYQQALRTQQKNLRALRGES